MKFKIDPSLNIKKNESGLYLKIMFNNQFVEHLSGEERIKALKFWLEHITDDDKKVEKENYLRYNSNIIGEYVDLPRINGQETDFILMDMNDECPVDEILTYYKRVMKLGNDYGVAFEILKETHFQYMYSIYDTDFKDFERFELIDSLLLKIKGDITGIIYDDIESNVGRTIEKIMDGDTVSLISKCYFGSLFDTSTIELSRIKVAQEIDNFTLKCRKFFKVLHKELGINIWTGE